MAVAVGPDWIDRGLVFPGPGGDFLKPATLSQRFDRLIARIDVPRIRVHDLRHTYATLQVEDGGVRERQDRLTTARPRRRDVHDEPLRQTVDAVTDRRSQPLRPTTGRGTR